MYIYIAPRLELVADCAEVFRAQLDHNHAQRFAPCEKSGTIYVRNRVKGALQLLIKRYG